MGYLKAFRTCLHKKYMWIFEHNFVADKAKIRRRAVARQVFFTQYAAKFAEKTRVYACEDRFSIYDIYCLEYSRSCCIARRSNPAPLMPISSISVPTAFSAALDINAKLSFSIFCPAS